MIYCPECENRCSVEAPFCPKCGHPLKPLRPNIDDLADAIAPIPVAAPVPDPLPGQAVQPPTPEAQHVIIQGPAWNGGVAAVLSFFIPGLGQLYKGQVVSAVVWFGMVAAGYVFFIVPGIILHFCCVVGATMGDPYRKPHRSFHLT